MKVRIKKYDSSRARALSERFGLPILASTIMARREMPEEEVMYSLEDDILYQHSPFTVDDVYTAVERIQEALDEEDGKEQEKILIFGDRDVDGVTSTAIMIRTLRKLGAKNVSWRLPHGDESYGLTDDAVDEILESGVTLVITVDNGISAIEEIKRLEKIDDELYTLKGKEKELSDKWKEEKSVNEEIKKVKHKFYFY